MKKLGQKFRFKNMKRHIQMLESEIQFPAAETYTGKKDGNFIYIGCLVMQNTNHFLTYGTFLFLLLLPIFLGIFGKFVLVFEQCTPHVALFF
jgi:hypothetical protein